MKNSGRAKHNTKYHRSRTFLPLVVGSIVVLGTIGMY